MRIELDADSLGTGPDGLEIGVKGFKHDPTAVDEHPTQLFLEVYEGKLRIHVWDGDNESPTTLVVDPAT